MFMANKWYVVHTYTGHEEKVRANLEQIIPANNLQDSITSVLIPTEEVVEIKSNKRKVKNRKFFPGYVLVEMEMNETTWSTVKSVPGITGFLGGNVPVPLLDNEVEKIKKLMITEKGAKPKPAVLFEKDENVRIIEGPFSNFIGVVEEVNMERGKLKVMVTIFGRPTPVELDFLQVEKI